MATLTLSSALCRYISIPPPSLCPSIYPSLYKSISLILIAILVMKSDTLLSSYVHSWNFLTDVVNYIIAPAERACDRTPVMIIGAARMTMCS